VQKYQKMKSYFEIEAGWGRQCYLGAEDKRPGARLDDEVDVERELRLVPDRCNLERTSAGSAAGARPGGTLAARTVCGKAVCAVCASPTAVEGGGGRWGDTFGMLRNPAEPPTEGRRGAHHLRPEGQRIRRVDLHAVEHVEVQRVRAALRAPRPPHHLANKPTLLTLSSSPSRSYRLV